MENNDLFKIDYLIHFENTNHTHKSASARILSFIRTGLLIVMIKNYSYRNGFLGNSGYSVPISLKEKYKISDILGKIITCTDGSLMQNRGNKYTGNKAL